MQTDKEHHQSKLEKLKSLRGCKSEEILESRLLKEIEKSDTQRLKEISNALINETRLKLSDAKRARDIISIAREEVNTSTRHSTLDISKVNLKPLVLPRLQLPEKTLNQVADPTEQNMLSPHKSKQPIPEKKLNQLPDLANQSLLSPRKNNPKLHPLFSMTNSVSRAGYKSRVGSIKGKPKLHNEDSVMIQPNLQKIRGQYLFAISDGHGTNGHTISEFIKDHYPNTLQTLLPVEPRLDQIDSALTLSTEKIEESLKSTSIDRMFSGATLISVLICGNILVCSSLGDCKSYIYNLNQKWSSVPLHCLHTLKNKKERERMINNNARIAVEVIEETNEVISTEKAYMGSDDTPGLEITRSIGDKIGKYIGMSPSPENKVYQLTPGDKFIVIGSTGFWNVICETDALCIVRNSWEEGKIENACEDLIGEADRRWKKSGKDRDDVSVIIVFLAVN